MGLVLRPLLYSNWTVKWWESRSIHSTEYAVTQPQHTVP